MGERDTRVQDITAIRADLAKGLADNRKVHAESHSQLEALLELERKARQDLMETERVARNRDLQDMRNHVSEVQNTEKGARKGQLEEMMLALNAENAERDQKLDGHRKAHKELSASHGQLANFHKQGHQGHLDRHSRLEDLLGSEQNKRLLDLQQMEEVHNTKVANLQSELKRLETSVAAAEKLFQARQNELGSNLDSKYQAVNTLLEERFRSVESRLDANEAHMDANTIGLEANNHTATTSLSELRRRISEAEGSLECSLRAQKETASKVNATAEQLTTSFRTESAQRCLSFKELETKVNEELLAIKTRTEEIRKETMQGYNLAHDNLDRS